MKLWQRFAVALTTALLLFGGQIRMWTDARNRFLEHWDHGDAWSLLLGVVLLAAIFTAIREVLSLHPLGRRIASHAFVLIFVGGIVSTFRSYPDYKTELLFIAAGMVVAVSWLKPAWRIPNRLAILALVFSPAAFIIGNQLVRYPQWTEPEPLETAVASKPEASPVFFFVFDEWSHARSTEGGELLPLFKNLRALSQQCWTFDFAQSPGQRTDLSLPRLMWQRDDTMLIGEGETFWPKDDARVRTNEVPSLFASAKSSGYATALRGFYLPYRRMLGDQLDTAVSYLEHPKAETFGHKLWANGLRNLGFQHDPVSRRICKSFEASVFLLSKDGYSRHWELINRKLRNDTLGLINKAAPNTFSFVHFPLPHCPWIFRPDGTYAGPYTGARMSHDIEGYRNHLAYLDLVIGQFLDAMRRAGKFDNATIVITSDHSWRLDSTYDGKLRDGEDVRHVPLFIKLPRQTTPGRVTQKFELTKIGPVLEAVFAGSPENAQAALERLK